MSQANQLAKLLHDRKGYVFQEPKQPFTLSVVKAMSSRNIKISTGEGQDVIEDARRFEILSEALAKIFYGRPKDIEALIACGVFKPAARELATQM